MHKPIIRFVKSIEKIVVIVFTLLATSCSGLSPTTTPELILVQYSIFTQPWLVKLDNCAGKRMVEFIQRSTDFQDPKSVDLVMRIGMPDNLPNPVYQIGTEDIIIIVNPQNPTHTLSADQVRGIFAGQIQTWKSINSDNAPIQVIIFPTNGDIENLFEHSILNGSPIPSQARVVNNPNEMMQAILKNENAIGIITRQWNIKKSRLYSLLPKTYQSLPSHWETPRSLSLTSWGACRSKQE